MKFLANEKFPLTSLKILSEAGFDITGIGIDFHGISDKDVIELAQRERRTILTFDRDYGELIFKKGLKPDAGVIYLRWDDFKPDEPGRYLVELFKSTDIVFDKMHTVISEKTIRQRKIL